MKKILTLVLLASGTTLLQADYPAQSGSTTYQQGQYYQNTPQQGSGYSSTYESNQTRSTQNKTYQGSAYQNNTGDLGTRVQNALKNSKYSGVTATVSNGAVTLHGTVPSEEDKVALGALVGGIDGVKTVNNQVTTPNSGTNTYGSQGYSGSRKHPIKAAGEYPKVPQPPQPKY